MACANNLHFSRTDNYGNQHQVHNRRNNNHNPNSVRVDGAARHVIQNPQPHQGRPYNPNIAINKRITSSANTGALMKILQDDFYSFNDVNVATFWSRLVKKGGIQFDDNRLKDIIDYTYSDDILPKLDGRVLSGIIGYFVKLGCKNDYYYLAPLKEAVRNKLENGNDFSSQNFANIAWAFAKLEHKDPIFTQALIDSIRQKLEDQNNPHFFNGQDLSSIACSFAKLEHKDPIFIQALTDSIRQKLEDQNNPNFFNGQDLASIAWAFAKLEHKDPIFTQAIIRRIGPKLEDQNNPNFFNGLELANIAKAFVKFEYKDPRFKQALIRRIGPKLEDQNNPNFFKGQELANIAWAFAKLEHKDLRFTQALIKRIGPKLEDQNNPNFFNGQNLASIVKAFANLEHKDPKFTQALIDRIRQKLEDQNDPNFFNGQGFANIAWAFAKLEHKDPRFNQALIRRIGPKLEDKNDPNFFSGQGLANIASAFAKLEHKDLRFTQALIRRIGPKLEDQNDPDFFDGQELANIAWAFAKLEHKDPRFTQALIDRIRQKLEDQNSPNFFNGQNLANIAWAFVKLEHKNPIFTQALIDRIGQKLEDQNSPNFFNDQDLANIAWSVLMMDQVSEYPSFVQVLLQKINNKFKSGGVFNNEQLYQLLQLREILPIESRQFNIPWSKELNEEIDKFKNSLTPPPSSRLHKDVMIHLEKVLKKKGGPYDLFKEKYELGFYLDNVIFLNGKKIAMEVCGPCHYYVNQPEILLPEFVIKLRILQRQGIEVVVVHYSRWYKLSDEEKDNYLIGELKKVIQKSPEERPGAQSNVDKVCADLEELSIGKPADRQIIDERKE